MKNLFKLFYYQIVFKSFFKSEEQKIKEEILYKQKVIDRIKQNLKYNFYQSELDYLLEIERKHKEDKRHLEAKNEVLIEELDEMQDKNAKQCRINEQFFFKLHNIEEREANIVKIEASQIILNSELAKELTINLK